MICVNVAIVFWVVNKSLRSSPVVGHVEHNLCVLDRHSRQWQTIREIDLPYDPKINGEGLSQDMSIDEMDDHFDRILQEPPIMIPLEGLKTDHLRIVCDREHPGEDHCQVVPEGVKHAVFELALDNFQPDEQEGAPEPGDGLKKHWGTVFSCFRPEFRGFSNHSASTNCHLSQGPPIEIVAHTKRSANGPDPLDLARYTIGRALLDGGGYGYWRSLYLDSDPVLLSAAGRIHQSDPDIKWLKQIKPGLVETVKRMLSLIGENGMPAGVRVGNLI